MLYENSSAHLVYRLLPTINTNIAENVPCKVNKYRYISGYRLGTLFVKPSVTKNELLRTRYCTVLYCTVWKILDICVAVTLDIVPLFTGKNQHAQVTSYSQDSVLGPENISGGEIGHLIPPPPPFPIDPYYITLY